MNAITATITGVTLIAAERNDSGLVCRTLLETVRPATFAAADEELAFASLVRMEDWELGRDGVVEARVTTLDNRFDGTVAVRLGQAIGTTHESFETVSSAEIEVGDIITDREISELYVVAGTSVEGDSVKVHMVREGDTWADRYTSDFDGFVTLARRKA
jgi:hypothetical protein